MVTKLREGVWWLDLRGTNAYLVDDGGDLTLIDAGLPWHGDAIVAGIADAGLALADLDRVLVTHYDVDHVGGLPAVDGPDVDLYAGGDAPHVAGRERPAIASRKGLFQRIMGTVVSPPDSRIEPLADGETVGSFTVYETPGHTPGHVAYVSESLSAAFLGDAVRESDGRLAPAPWILNADTDAVRGSIRDLAERAPPFEVAAIGHGVPFERGGKARLDELAATL